MKKGEVILVGAGPGDPGLLTIKGRNAIESADVVVYDRLVSPEILDLIPADAEWIDVGKESSHHKVPQEQINRILLEKALEGKRVVRLKGGDPFLFGRGGEELELLAEHGVAFQEIPGITSAIGGSRLCRYPGDASGLLLFPAYYHRPSAGRKALEHQLRCAGTNRRHIGVFDGRKCPCQYLPRLVKCRDGPGYARGCD